MARGATKTMEQMSQNQLGLANKAAGTAGTEAGQAFNTALPVVQQMATNPGYTPGEKTATLNADLGGIGASYGAARDTALNRAGATNNMASSNALLDQLARQQGVASGQAAAGVQEKFADARMKQQQEAAQDAGQLFGQAGNQQIGLLGQGNEAITNYGRGIASGGGVLRAIDQTIAALRGGGGGGGQAQG